MGSSAGNSKLHFRPSMKVPPKRKGNLVVDDRRYDLPETLNESPSEKEGKSHRRIQHRRKQQPSMKVPPKRKGNSDCFGCAAPRLATLNESPSEKEGKSGAWEG